MVSLPSHATDIGYPKQSEFALAAWLAANGLAGGALAALGGRRLDRRLGGDAAGRRMRARIEAGAILAGWIGILVLAFRAWLR